MIEIVQTMIHSELFLLTLTVAIFSVGSFLHKKSRSTLLHPVVLTLVALIAFLKITGVEYSEFRAATKIMDFMLSMSVVSLGYLMYEQSNRLKEHFTSILATVVSSSVVAIVTTVYVAMWFGAPRIMVTSIAPKSVTIPIAVSISGPLGADVNITAVVVFCVGLFGNIFGAWILDRCGVKSPMARGLAYGTAAHGIGTAKAIQEGTLQGAVSGLAMALMGVGTAVLLPLFEKFLY